MCTAGAAGLCAETAATKDAAIRTYAERYYTAKVERRRKAEDARRADRKRQLGMQQQQAALLAPGAAQARAQQQQQPVALPALQTYPKLDHEQTMPGLVYLACPANVG